MNRASLKEILMSEEPKSTLLSKKSSHSLDPLSKIAPKPQYNFILDGA